jgi:hypothetical protein
VKLSAIDGATVAGLSATRDGTRLAFARVETQIDVHAMAIGPAPAEPLRLTLDDRPDTLVGWASNSQAVYIESARGIGTHVYRHALGPGDPTFVRSGLPDSSGPWPRRVTLTPDRSGLLAFAPVPGSSDEEPRLGLFLAPLSRGSARRIGWFDFPARDLPSVRCFTVCVIGRMAGDRMMVFQDLDLEEGLGRVIGEIDVSFAPGAATGWDLSDDASALAVPLGREIAIVERSGSIHILVPEHDAVYMEVGWGAGGDWLTAAALVPPSTRQLVRISAAGGTEVLHADESGSTSWFAPMVSPDRRHLAFNSRTVDVDAWTLEGL